MLEIYQLFQTLTYYYHLSLLFIFIFQYLIKYFTLYTKKVHLILDYPLTGCIMYLRVRKNKPQNKEIENNEKDHQRYTIRHRQGRSNRHRHKRWFTE